MRPPLAVRLALRAYPPSFRDRYGGELEALVDDLPASAATVPDLLVGAARSWLRPSFAGADGARRRLQATAATTWVAWCAGFLIAPAVNRALMDPPVAGANATVRSLLDIAQFLFFVGWAVVLLGAVPLVAGALIPAVRARQWARLRSLVPALVLGAIEAAGFVTLVQLRSGVSSTPSTPVLVLAGLWLFGFVLFVCCLGAGPALAVERLNPRAGLLRIPVALAVPVALTLAAITGCSLAAAVLAGDPSIAGSAVPVVGALVVACVASVVALVSSGRGIRALRST